MTAMLREATASALPQRSPTERPKLLFLVTEDWYFWSHRLPVARAARDAGFEVVVAARVREHGDRIRAEGFRLVPLQWRRRGDGALGAVRSVASIARLYRRERPDIVHNVALKPALFGAAALRLAFPCRTAGRPAVVAAVNGLGSGLTFVRGGARLLRPVIGRTVGRAVAGARVIVQNPEDGAALAELGIDPGRIAVIRGSGVDTAHFTPFPEPVGPTVTIALVARMLRSKGVPDAVAAMRLLRTQDVAVRLLLAGPTDPDNRDSLDAHTLATLVAEPGTEWLGAVPDVRTVWRRAAIAVLPSTYGEGVPMALLEAASCARPIVATDMPGCREIVRHGETGLLVPPHNVGALAAAIAELARDPARRRAMGLAGRSRVEALFGKDEVARQTLSLWETVLRERNNAAATRRRR